MKRDEVVEAATHRQWRQTLSNGAVQGSLVNENSWLAIFHIVLRTMEIIQGEGRK